MLNSDNHIVPIRPTIKDKPLRINQDRPQGPPKSKKDFRKIIQDPNSDNRQEEEELGAVEEKSEIPSPFDLSRKTAAKFKPNKINQDIHSILDPETELAAKEQAQSSNEGSTIDEDEIADASDTTEESDNSNTMTTKENSNNPPRQLGIPDPANQLIRNRTLNEQLTKEQTLKSSRLSDTLLETDATAFASKQKGSLSRSISNRADKFAQEKTDLAALAPHSSSAAINPNPQTIDDDSPELSQKTTIKDLVDQIVKSMQVAKYDGKTDTTIILRQPPIFEGSQITLTSFDTAARNEFNLAFTNLSVTAKSLIDAQQNALTQALEQKGYVIQMLTTTTLAEAPTYNPDAKQFARQDERQQGQRNPNREKDQEQT